jgi:hypothetical protein
MQLSLHSDAPAYSANFSKKIVFFFMSFRTTPPAKIFNQIGKYLVLG